MYPADQQNQIRSMLANTLQAVVSQTLFKRVDRKGMVPGGGGDAVYPGGAEPDPGEPGV